MPLPGPTGVQETGAAILRGRTAGTTSTDSGLPEGIEGVPIIVNGQIIGWNIGGEFFTQEEVDTLIATGKFPEDPTGTGTTGRTQFESERALDEAQTRLSNANAALAELAAAGTQPISPFQQAQLGFQKQQLELDKIRAENDLKEAMLGQIGAERRTLIQEKGAERGRQTELAGRDVFKFTANLRGRSAGSAPTPVDVFKQQGAEFINQPLPQFDINSPLPQLQAGLSALQKLEAPQGQGLFGLAHGGTIQMEKGADGKFGQKQAFFVGENPDGTINDTTEILITGGGKTEVIPISGGAQGGLDIPNLNLGGFPDLLSFLRKSTGVTNAPALLGGTRVLSDVLSPQNAAAFGARQRPLGSFVRNRDDPEVFIVTPEGLRSVGSPEIFGGGFGASASDVEFLAPSAFGRLRQGGVGDPFTSIEEAQGFEMPLTGTPAFQAFGQPLNTLQGFLELAAINPDFSESDARALAKRIGFLPSPHKIAQEIGIGGANLDDAEISGLISLYGLAGVPLETIFRQVEAATPQGRFSRPQRIGFTGSRI
ncbi:hypothetical protein LCGC14_0779920 [marine sediment metagenome]|uniref:Uncharacterized protein n=1 Tax=marine sediment metagenome TaxID=412755 RepID=A0A0F9T2Z0_9ZZZZ